MSGRGALLVTAVVVVVLVAPLLAPQDPMQMDTLAGLQPPSEAHLLGTDRFGRDMLSRLLYGAQRTLSIATLATGIAIVPGLLLGLAAGMGRASIDGAIMALINALLAFPGFLLALVVVTLVGAGTFSIALATGIALLAQYARVVRAAVYTVRGQEYVEAARALGAPSLRVMLGHILPNVMPTLLAYAGVMFSYSLLNSAALSFLGLGGDLGAPDWGAMLFEGRMTFQSAPWVSFAPGLALTLVVLAVNSAADRLSRGDEH
jgi:peptide/nickel transport system permease protein